MAKHARRPPSPARRPRTCDLLQRASPAPLALRECKQLAKPPPRHRAEQQAADVPQQRRRGAFLLRGHRAAARRRGRAAGGAAGRGRRAARDGGSSVLKQAREAGGSRGLVFKLGLDLGGGWGWGHGGQVATSGKQRARTIRQLGLAQRPCHVPDESRRPPTPAASGGAHLLLHHVPLGEDLKAALALPHPQRALDLRHCGGAAAALATVAGPAAAKQLPRRGLAGAGRGVRVGVCARGGVCVW
jgi:hypothetical protein